MPAGTGAAAAAEFIEDVDTYMRGQRVEDKLAELQERFRICKQQEQELLVRKARLTSRLPEIKSALEAVLGLLARKEAAGAGGAAGGQEPPLLVDYELTEGIYAKAALQDVDAVNLWLGANVMVEYTLPEAKQLLQQQQEACEGGLAAVAAQLEAVKSSIATTEVTMARVFNWDVEQRRKAKAAGVGGGGAAASASVGSS